VGFWDDYGGGLRVLSYALGRLQTESDGFRLPDHPDRVYADPACLCVLLNGVLVYAETHPEFAPFAETVQRDYKSHTTGPATFQQPIYHQLREVIDEQLRSRSHPA
jgi:hypothetical protein